MEVSEEEEGEAAIPSIRQVGDRDKRQTVHHAIRETQLSRLT